MIANKYKEKKSPKKVNTGITNPQMPNVDIEIDNQEPKLTTDDDSQFPSNSNSNLDLDLIEEKSEGRSKKVDFKTDSVEEIGEKPERGVEKLVNLSNGTSPGISAKAISQAQNLFSTPKSSAKQHEQQEGKENGSSTSKKRRRETDQIEQAISNKLRDRERERGKENSFANHWQPRPAVRFADMGGIESCLEVSPLIYLSKKRTRRRRRYSFLI